MKRALAAAYGSVVFAGAACAASGNNDAPTRPDPVETILDAAMPDATVADANGVEAAADDGTCSEDGWCVTALPDADLVLRDIWPVEGHAFAVAESATVGTKVLEWDDAGATWTYIDDSTQNEPGVGTYVGKIWAPNANEVYYGVSPGYIYHGVRSATPGSAWTWTRDLLADHSHPDKVEPDDGRPDFYWKLGARYPALGVWGTASGDLYAWFTNTIYHWSSVDGDAPTWVAEYTADDPDAPTEHLLFLGATATQDDELWFSGARSRTSAGCALLVHKGPAGYERVADGVLAGSSSPCAARENALLIGGSEGWLTDIQAISPNQIAGLKGGRDIVRITSEGGNHSVAIAPVPSDKSLAPNALNSLWFSSNEAWLSSTGLIVRGADVWGGGSYQLSSVALRGKRATLPFYQVRGTSNSNLWAIGIRNALRKTTP
jgi:hypothetical protein